MHVSISLLGQASRSSYQTPGKGRAGEEEGKQASEEWRQRQGLCLGVIGYTE